MVPATAFGLILGSWVFFSNWETPPPTPLQPQYASSRHARSVKPVPQAIRKRQGFEREESAGLFVGIRVFQNSQFTEIPYAVDDAVDLAHVFALELDLIDPRKVVLSLSGDPQKPFSRVRLQKLLDAGASRVSSDLLEIYRQLEAQGNATGDKGLFVLALSTHGFTREGSDFLAAADSLPGRLILSTAIAAKEIFYQASLARAPRRVVFLDACRERLTRKQNIRGGIADSAMGHSLKEAISKASGQVVLSCTTQGGYCYDDPERGNGVFTGAVISGLQGGAYTNEEGFITVRNLAEFVQRKTVDWVRRHRRNHVQISTGISSRFEGGAASMPLAVDPVMRGHLLGRQDALSKLRRHLSDPVRAQEFRDAFLEMIGGLLLYAPLSERKQLIERIESLDDSPEAPGDLVEYLGRSRMGFTADATLQALEVSGDLVTGILSGGQKWRRSYGTPISSKLLVDLDQDGKREALLGFAGDGARHSTVLAVDSNGEERWHFTKEPNYPYSGAQSGRFQVIDLNLLQLEKPVIVVTFNDASWYPSVITLLDLSGKPQREFWHSGQFQQTVTFGDLIVASAFNNDLGQLPQFWQRSGPRRHISVLFALRPEKVYGQSPPFFGKLKPNNELEWYLFLSDRAESFRRLSAYGDRLEIWTSCGLMFQLDRSGKVVGGGRADDYSCEPDLELRAIKFRR